MTVNGDPQQTSRASASRRLGLIAISVAIGALAGVTALYGIGGWPGNAGDPACQPALSLARRIEPFAKGEVAAVTPATKALMVPDLTFQDASGAQRRLSDFRGSTLLLNLWATWCVPCRKEMPALDELQAKLGSDQFKVVAINIDTRDPEKPKAWLKETGVTSLAYFSDEKAKAFQDLKLIGKAFGMPTSMLIDPRGCEIGSIAGPAEWASDDALKLIRAALVPPI